MTKNGHQLFPENMGVTPSVATPGDTIPSDATGRITKVFNDDDDDEYNLQ